MEGPSSSSVPATLPIINRSYGIERLGALTDGVFAVALTLLVLDLKVPEVPAGQEQILHDDLIELIPNAVAWVVSFALLARYWTVHHDVLASLAKINVRTIVTNFFVLILASTVPFATALIGTYEFNFIPVAIFSMVMALTGISIGLFSGHARTLPPVHGRHNPDLNWHARYHTVGIPLFAVVAITAAWFAHPAIALVAWLIEPLIALRFARRQSLP